MRNITLWGLTWSPLSEKVWDTVPQEARDKFKVLNAELYQAHDTKKPDHIYVGVYPRGWPNDNAPMLMMYMHESGLGYVKIAKLAEDGNSYNDIGVFMGSDAKAKGNA